MLYYKKFPIETCILLGTLIALLLALQHWTLVKLEVEPAGSGLISFTTFAHNLLQKVTFTPADLGLAFAILIVCVLLLIAELWFRSLTRFLDQALATDRGALALCAIICLVLVRYYFAPGQPTWAGDSGGHITYATIAARSLAAGEWPIWTNAFSTGSPYAQFYGFMFFYLVGLCDLLVDDPFNSIKLVTGLSHWLSGLAMYLLAHAVTGSRRAALLAGIGYVASFWHVQQVMIMGRLPLSVFYALLPLPFYALERVHQNGLAAKPVVGGALSLGLLAFVHAGYAFWGVLFWFVYAVLRLGRNTDDRMLGTAAILIGGLVFGAQQTLPMWLERDHAGLASGIHLGGGAVPGWQQLLVWSNAYFRLWPLPPEQHNWLSGYLGLSLVVVTLVGLGTATISYRRPLEPAGRATLACLFLALLIVLAHSGPILSNLAVVQAFNAGRYLLFVVFFLAIGCGLGVHWILLHCPAPGRVYTLLLLLVLVDLGSTTFRHLYIPRWAQPVNYPADIVRDTAAKAPTWPELPNYRLFATTQRHHFYLLVPWLYGQTHIPQIQSTYFAAPQAWSFTISPWTEFVGHYWGDVTSQSPTQPQTEFLLAGAKLFNVQEILAAQTEEAVARIKIPNASPVLASPSIASYSEEATYIDSAEASRVFPATAPELLRRIKPFYWLTRSMEIDLAANTCERIYVRNRGPHAFSQTKPQVEVLVHRVYNQRVQLRLQATEPCYIRLAYAYYPHLQITVDSHKIEPIETAGHFIALPLDAGSHDIEITAHLSPLRQALLLLNMVLLSGGAVWMWIARKKSVSDKSIVRPY